MRLQENISLKPFNTFGVDARARYFARFSDVGELEESLNSDSSGPRLVLGGGSNILLTRDFDGLVLKNEIPGITQLHEDNEYVYVKAGAGENWHQFVQYCIERNWAGVENLSLIPGNVGAAPMQNIGAYGVEIGDLFWDLEAYHIEGNRVVTFTRTDCEFGYRNSIFKNRFREQFIILNVTFQLRKHPRFHTRYGAIEQELQNMGVKELSIRAISEAVIRIRSSKLPDPRVTGNAGSFFKNPIVSKKQYDSIRSVFSNIVGHENLDGTIKIAAGWLIEHCGPDEGASWKGYIRGHAGCYEKQALVLVNYGGATGSDILELSEEIRQSVESKFGIRLEREVNIY